MEEQLIGELTCKCLGGPVKFKLFSLTYLCIHQTPFHCWTSWVFKVDKYAECNVLLIWYRFWWLILIDLFKLKPKQLTINDNWRRSKKTKFKFCFILTNSRLYLKTQLFISYVSSVFLTFHHHSYNTRFGGEELVLVLHQISQNKAQMWDVIIKTILSHKNA